MNIKELFENLSIQIEKDIEQKKAEIGEGLGYKRVIKNYPLQPKDVVFITFHIFSAHISLKESNISFELWRLVNNGFETKNTHFDTYLISAEKEIIRYHDTSFLSVPPIYDEFRNIESLSQKIIEDFLKFAGS